MAADEGEVDIYAWTWQMRKDRVNMIQTVVSCSFINHDPGEKEGEKSAQQGFVHVADRYSTSGTADLRWHWNACKNGHWKTRTSHYF